MDEAHLPKWKSIARKFTERALVGRWPRYKKQIGAGDLRICLGEDGYVFIQLPNTDVFSVGKEDLSFLVEGVFTEHERGSMGREALLQAGGGVKSITVGALVPRSQPKPQSPEEEA